MNEKFINEVLNECESNDINFHRLKESFPSLAESIYEAIQGARREAIIITIKRLNSANAVKEKKDE